MKHVKKHTYSDIGLLLRLFKDLRKDGLTGDALWVFRNRHTCKLDNYGWPIDLPS